MGRKLSEGIRSVSGMSNTQSSDQAAGTGAVLASILAGLDSLESDRTLASPKQRLEFVDAALAAAGRLTALATTLLGEADAQDAASIETALVTTSWLTERHRLTRREASAMVHEARALQRLEELREGCLSGDVNPQQSRVITSVLKDLPPELGPEEKRAAERTMVTYAQQFDSAALARLSRHLLDVVAPEVAEASDAERLERDAASAARNRFLAFSPDHHGSVLVRGSLPLASAELLVAQIDACAHLEHRRALDRLDPRAEQMTPAMRRADALIWIAESAALHRDAPSHGGDRPRVVVTMTQEWLSGQLESHGLLPSGESISPSDLRQLACDADVLPVVLGGASEPLDVGRAHRLVTPAIRAALSARDQGCAFPGCDKPPVQCHAHHIQPWFAGGATSLDNLVLVCPHHHRVVEPTRAEPHHRWQIRLNSDAMPEVVPPRIVDRDQRPRRHQRFRIPHRRGAPGAEPVLASIL